ncbi:MAG: hypothetical protein E7167_02670 [Firmicutes bacterium]|nr:hypothetical protein [Bacillota bacterium]
MKNIINLERKLYKDIVITVLLVILSVPIWLNFGLSASAMTAKNFANYNYIKYEFLNKVSTELGVYSDEEALRKCETQDILVYNDSNTLDNYSLILKVKKNNQTDLTNIKINVNYNVDYLNNYHFYEDAESYYYVIDSDSIVASSQKYVISMWNSDLQTNTNLDYEFVVL